MKTIAFVEDGRLKTLMPAKKSLEKALETAPAGSIIVDASEIPEKRYRSACTIQFGVIQKDLDRFPVIDAEIYQREELAFVEHEIKEVIFGDSTSLLSDLQVYCDELKAYVVNGEIVTDKPTRPIGL